jgi:hypothetical protein
MVNYTSNPSMTLAEAKKVLGTTSIGMSDDAIMRLIAQVDVLTDIVVAHSYGSIIQSHIDNIDDEEHTYV